MWSGVEDLFGRKFLRHLVEEAKSQATLEGIAKKNKKSSSTKDQPAGPSGQFNKSNNHSNPGSRDGYVSISPYSFGGRISRFVDVWRTITGDPWILETVQNGLSLDFISPATQRRIPRNAVMNSEQIGICAEEITSLLEKGAITQVYNYFFVSGFFLVPKASGGWRPIINLKALNLFIQNRHLKMESVSTLRYTIRKGDWLAKVDLKDAYFSVALNQSQRNKFCFKWGEKICQYVSMPFCLGPAPRVFTKLLKPIVGFLLQQGLRLVVYLDDILIIGHSREEAQEAVKQVVGLLESLGFVIQEEKSVREPSQSLEYIGLMIDTISMSCILHQKKKEILVEQCSRALKSKTITLRELASILSIFNWAAQSVNYSPANYRDLQAIYIQQSKLAHGDLSLVVTLSSEAKSNLSWWIKRANFSEGRKITFPTPSSIIIFSDASLSGWGTVSDRIKTGGPWTKTETQLHINELELMAAFNGLEFFAATAHQTSFEINIDNTTAVAYINKKGVRNLAHFAQSL